MKTEIIRLAELSAKDRAAAISRAADIIRSGELVAFPTETVYGLAADGLSDAACRKIFRAKGRPADNPLILHFADSAAVETVAAVTPTAAKLMAAFCPGPLALVLPKKGNVPASVSGGLDTVGVRLPDNDIARELIRAVGRPLAAPSANRSGRPSPTSANAVAADMDGIIPLILDGGSCRYGVESTIVDCSAAEDSVTVLRPGAVTVDMLAEIVGDVRLEPSLAAISGRTGEAKFPAVAPALKYAHYVPTAPLTLVSGTGRELADKIFAEYRQRVSGGEIVALILTADTLAAFEGLCAAVSPSVPNPQYIYVLPPKSDLAAVAARLYDALRYFDKTPVTSIIGETFPADGLGLAVINRLVKAAAGKII